MMHKLNFLQAPRSYNLLIIDPLHFKERMRMRILNSFQRFTASFYFWKWKMEN